jgi:hypothetical protein
MRGVIQKLLAIGINMNKNTKKIKIFCLGGWKAQGFKKRVLGVFYQ